MFVDDCSDKLLRPASLGRKPRGSGNSRRSQAEHRIDRTLVDANAGQRWCRPEDAGGFRGLRRRWRRARPAAAGHAAEGLRRRDERHARAGQGAVPPRLHHRAALPHRPRGVQARPRARGDRGLDLPRHARGAAAEQVAGQREDLARRACRQGARRRRRGPRLRDNVWGPQIEDAARDFTVNAMYYDPLTETGRTTTTASGTPAMVAAHDRRPGGTLYRGSGAHQRARGALRRQARLRDRGEDARPSSRCGAARQPAAVAPVRRDDQTFADRARAGSIDSSGKG